MMLRGIRAKDISARPNEWLLGISAKSCDQTHMVDEVDLGHINGFIRAKRSLEAVETETHRIGTLYKLLKCAGKTLTVVGTNGPDDDRAPVRQSFRNLIFAWFHNQPDARK